MEDKIKYFWDKLDEQHPISESDCVAYGEGQLCCLDKGHNTRKLINEILKEILRK